MRACAEECFRSVKVLLYLYLGEQTDTDTPVVQKSAILPKPNDAIHMSAQRRDTPIKIHQYVRLRVLRHWQLSAFLYSALSVWRNIAKGKRQQQTNVFTLFKMRKSKNITSCK